MKLVRDRELTDWSSIVGRRMETRFDEFSPLSREEVNLVIVRFQPPYSRAMRVVAPYGERNVYCAHQIRESGLPER